MPKERLSLQELIAKKIGKATGYSPRKAPIKTQEARVADRRCFIARHEIPIESINAFDETLYIDDNEEHADVQPPEDPILFQPSWIAPYSNVYVVIAGLEDTQDHIKLAEAAHILTGSPAFHINYAAIPAAKKRGYQIKLDEYLRKVGKKLNSYGMIFAVTCKRGHSVAHEPVNIPRRLRYFAAHVIVPDYANPKHMFYRILKSRMFKHGMTIHVSTEDVQFVLDNASEENSIKDFKFQYPSNA